MTVEVKLPYEVKAARKTDPKDDIDNIAIWPEKGIPMKSPNGKTWLLYIDDDGNLVTSEVVE